MQTPLRHIVVILVIFFSLSHFLGAQNTNNLDSFKEFALSYQKTNKTGMWILGSWAVGNMLIGGISLASGARGEGKYFQQMNIAWNVVNVGLAGFGLHQAYSSMEGLAWHEIVDNHHQMQKILLLNAGLDVAYIATGFFLMEKSNNVSKLPERLSGFGKSLILQGSFLLLFDVSMVLAHQHNGKKMKSILEKIRIEGTNLTLRHYF
ncbi:MAG: hypothetical protein OHK0045_08060 [Raineya sp.]